MRIGGAIRYRAIPLGTELDPFLEAMEMQGENARTPENLEVFMDRIKSPARIDIYVTPNCPFCPEAVRQLFPIAREDHFITLTIIDGALFPEEAVSNNVRSAPTILLDGYFRWAEATDPEEILEFIANRDSLDFSPRTLKNLLLSGNASRFVEIMLAKEKMIPSFPDMLAHGQFSVRLGAMVAMEEMAERNIGLAAHIIEPAKGLFQGAVDQIRGDIIHVIGESGGASEISWLETVKNGEYGAEVLEAAEEAIEKIMERSEIVE